MNQHHYSRQECGSATGEASTTCEFSIDVIPGPWTVEVFGEKGATTRAQLMPGERLVIGSRSDSDLRVHDSYVSGCHCALDATGEELLLVDLSSRNGVCIGNERIASARLSATPSQFTIGKSTVVVHSARHAMPARDQERIEGLEGQSEPMTQLKRDILRVAKLRAPVLIVGETGAGKDLVAHSLHALSGRTGAYVPINVATIPETLADSELFGHCRGAFTGAHLSRIGAFEQAHKGTLFLDEIGELAPTVQAKILRILEDGVVRPVGSAEGAKVDVRVISATWASLAERSAAGRFRFDLLQRLSMVVIRVPPLRERRSDIPLLSRYWLKRHSAEVGQKHLTPTAIERLREHDWPGNVRELGGVIYRACVMSDSDVVDVDAICRALSTHGIKFDRKGRNPRELLVRAGGNVSEAARLAGLPRTTFRSWLGRTQRLATDAQEG
jgi:DNA-binding NtrC family response regulator